MRTKADEGFTLLELLVTMVVIGVLAAIAIPTLLSERLNAYRSAMRSDLHALVVSETAWNMSNSGYTSDTALLSNEGYRQSNGVVAHVAVTATSFTACTKHNAVSDWMVYDSATSSFTTSPTDCA